MKMAEALAAERRAHKAAARAARGQTSLGHSASAADTHAAVNPHHRSPSAAVEGLGPAPAFDEEDLKMAEALEAERRTKKAAARAFKAQDSLKTSPAVVENWGPPPAFDEEDLKMAEAFEAERRAKKAARALKAQGSTGTTEAASTRSDMNKK